MPLNKVSDDPLFNIPFMDKMVHAGIFGIYAYLLSGYLLHRSKFNKNTVIFIFIVVTLSTAYGLFIEILQYFVPGRNFDFLDIIANFIGIIAANIIFQVKLIFLPINPDD